MMVNIELPGQGLIKEAFEFVNSIIVTPAKEVGELFADQVRYFRFKNQVKIINKAKKFLDEKGLEPRRVPMKTLANLLEYSSYEEDEDMQEKWAALLANAADPNNEFNLHGILAELLNQISPQESFLLDHLLNNSFIQTDRHRYEMPISQLRTFSRLTFHDSLIALDNLNRLNLIDVIPHIVQEKDNIDDDTNENYEYRRATYQIESDVIRKSKVRLSYLGVDLVRQCRII